MNELHQDGLQVTESGSSLHTETQLLLKVTTKGNLKCRKKNVTPKLKQKQQMQTQCRSKQCKTRGQNSSCDCF